MTSSTRLEADLMRIQGYQHALLENRGSYDEEGCVRHRQRHFTKIASLTCAPE
jgi:hypothetical protein